MSVVNSCEFFKDVDLIGFYLQDNIIGVKRKCRSVEVVVLKISGICHSPGQRGQLRIPKQARDLSEIFFFDCQAMFLLLG